MSSGRDMETTKVIFRERKPLFALALSFFMTGLGHVDNGKPRKGVLFFLASSLVPLLLIQISVAGSGLFPLATLGLSVAASLGIFVKRIVGLPGDEITIKGMELSVNGKSRTGKGLSREERAWFHLTQDDTIAVYEESDSGTYIVQFFEGAERKDMAITVAEGSCFVLSDNRDNSMDSRHWGSVPLIDVLSRAKQIYFSRDPEGGIRWERIGKRLHGKRTGDGSRR
jgi:signal peptidase I